MFALIFQVRLPTGRALRQTFHATAVLQDVWDYVIDEWKECDNTYHFMQVIYVCFIHSMIQILCDDTRS